MSRLDHTLKLVPASQRDIARDEIEALIKAERSHTLDEVEGLILMEDETELYMNLERADDQSITVNQEANQLRASLREQIKALKEK